MDDESTYPHSCSRYVPNYAHTWCIDLVEWLDTSRAKQTSAVIARPPSWPAISPALHVSEETMRDRGFNRDQTTGSHYKPISTMSDSSIQVSIQKSVFDDTNQAEEGSIERGIYPSPT